MTRDDVLANLLANLKAAEARATCLLPNRVHFRCALCGGDVEAAVETDERVRCDWQSAIREIETHLALHFPHADSLIERAPGSVQVVFEGFLRMNPR